MTKADMLVEKEGRGLKIAGRKVCIIDGMSDIRPSS